MFLVFMMYVKLKFFGIFRDYLNNEIDVKVDCGSNISDLKCYLRDEIFVGEFKILIGVLDKSIFSTDIIILSDDYILKSDDIIYLLPPFSGG